jgi:hypothetical protein
MTEYLVEWSIEVSADSPEEAARTALAIQRKHDSSATVFNVYAENGDPVQIDLTEIDEGRGS